ncbi:hypothetical protein GUJ93_ZPchr0012g22222 [Zizania palustris]|uniref:Uncharacterized protein n=1 Tax=Zizania palustris TaxID=103762 RepID=A0A8J6BTQ0_ZIZPA|nr:hypothetical protein GUJ93_ZPchr0012g22222 [Zizania palustris]
MANTSQTAQLPVAFHHFSVRRLAVPSGLVASAPRSSDQQGRELPRRMWREREANATLEAADHSWHCRPCAGRHATHPRPSSLRHGWASSPVALVPSSSSGIFIFITWLKLIVMALSGIL